MYAKNVFMFACAVSSLMGCTTRPDPEPIGPAVATPPPEVSIELPLEQQVLPMQRMAQACLLSTTKSCMELDPRPFEACLAGTPSCREKGEGGITLLEAPAAPVIDYPAPLPR